MRRAEVLGIMAAQLWPEKEWPNNSESARDWYNQGVMKCVWLANELLREAERVSPEPCGHEWVLIPDWESESREAAIQTCRKCGASR